jgi:hypothetical protein
MAVDGRPTTTTYLGDTGIWYVPTGAVLRGGTWPAGGTAEYSVALAGHRASAARDYFVGRGIAVRRLRTASYGEQDPEHAIAHEDTRRLSRMALVVRLQP